MKDLHKPDSLLLDQMADANDHTAEYIEAGNMPRPNGMSFTPPPELVSGMLRSLAAAQRNLAKDTREGKKIRERVSTDG